MTAEQGPCGHGNDLNTHLTDGLSENHENLKETRRKMKIRIYRPTGHQHLMITGKQEAGEVTMSSWKQSGQRWWPHPDLQPSALRPMETEYFVFPLHSLVLKDLFFQQWPSFPTGIIKTHATSTPTLTSFPPPLPSLKLLQTLPEVFLPGDSVSSLMI